MSENEQDVTALDLTELLSFDADNAVFRVMGRRSLMLDASALGALRKELIELFGMRVARGLMTRLGFNHGRLLGQAVVEAEPGKGWHELAMFGARLAGLQGHLVLGRRDPLGAKSAMSLWRHSWEAKQHLDHLGRASFCACWMLSGFTSGFLTQLGSEPVYSVEDECVARGDPVCRARVQPVSAWGAEIDEHLHAFRGEALPEALARLTAELRQTEGKIRTRRRALNGHDAPRAEPVGLIARSAAMVHVVEFAERVAAVDTTVLITGASGTGKERIARHLHERSPRADGPFVAINCGALTESLLEAELFGYARGAFTGAVEDRVGLFESAQGGTIFLDEIGEMPLGMQVRLLRVLQEREVRRVGDARPRGIDVRVLAATNRDLAEERAAGRFREDLYFRLRVVELRLPRLCERQEDIVPLSQALLSQIAGRLRRPLPRISPAAADALMRHAWPGNVRELGNALEHAVALARGETIEESDLPEYVRAPRHASAPSDPARPRTLEAVEREHITAVLAAHGGNQTLAARSLGIGTTTLYRKLKLYRADDASTGSPGDPGPRR